jgi:hypothetical protein
MKWTLTLFLMMVTFPGLFGAEKQFDIGKILDVQQKKTTRILYYQVDTPVTKDEPYFEVSVRVKDTVYVGDYSPRHAADTLPEEWNVPNAEVRIRMEKHFMFLIRPSGTEVQFVIVKRVPVASEKKISESPSPNK